MTTFLSAYLQHGDLLAEAGVALPEAPFYLDFSLLGTCDVLAISNSTFSFAASMLSDRGKSFFRPHIPTQKLIPFDPWNAEVLPVETEHSPEGDYTPSHAIAHFYEHIPLVPSELNAWSDWLLDLYNRSDRDSFDRDRSIAMLRQLRRYLAEFLVRWHDAMQIESFLEEIGNSMHDKLIRAELLREPLTPSERSFLTWLKNHVAEADLPRIEDQLALLLYVSPDCLPMPLHLLPLPDWLVE
jgi:hypothetical protein